MEDNNTKKVWLFIIGTIIITIIIILAFRYYIATPITVQYDSMSPTLNNNEKIIVSRTFRITKKMPKRGDIVTFEAPSDKYTPENIDESNPIAQYSTTKRKGFSKFLYNVVEITKPTYIKRVIALPGEHVQIKDGKVFINEKELSEKYLESDVKTESAVFKDFTVPEGYLFCLGDNREKSSDSRDLGCIPFEKITGKAFLRIWPFKKIN